MSVFRVVEDTYPQRVILETDDWVVAQAAALTSNWQHRIPRYVRGVHPTHEFVDGFLPKGEHESRRSRRCHQCGAWDNTSYSAQAPCGYDFSHDSLASAIKREQAARA